MGKGQAAQEELKDVSRSCRNKSRQVKALLELNLANSVKGNKKCFYKYIRRVEENHNSSPDATGNTFTKDEETLEVLATFFASLFKRRIDYPQDNWPPELGGREGEQNGTLVI